MLYIYVKQERTDARDRIEDEIKTAKRCVFYSSYNFI